MVTGRDNGVYILLQNILRVRYEIQNFFMTINSQGRSFINDFSSFPQ